MKKTGILLFALAFMFTVSLPGISQATPSFSRQLRAPCTLCHTIWPNLNAYGRQFKIGAYTDTSSDWQSVVKGNLNLLYILPLSARILFIPYEIEQDPEGGTPSAGSPGFGNGGFNSNQTVLDNMQIFFAGRVYDYAGVFTSVESGTIPGGSFSVAVSKIAFAYPTGGNILGGVLFFGQSTSADPFNSFGGWDRDIATPDGEGLPWVLTKGWTSDFWSVANAKLGGTLHAYLLGSRLYAAVTAYRNGEAADADGSIGFMHQLPSNPFTSAEGLTASPFAEMARLAWDQPLPNGSFTIGGAASTGQQKVLATDGTTIVSTRVNREFVDASLEQNFGKDHLFEAKAIYGFGQESGLTPLETIAGGVANTLGPGDDKRRFNGGAVEADYFYKIKYGVVGQYNWVVNTRVNALDFDPATSQHSWLVSLNYLPWFNTKFQFIYANIKSNYVTGGTVATPSETDKILKFMVDVAF